MGGIVHEPAHPSETESEQTIARNTRLGIILFFIYLALYGVFMLLCALWPWVMEAVLFPGLNVAVFYGLALIVAALVLALLYGWLSRSAAPDTSRGTRP